MDNKSNEIILTSANTNKEATIVVSNKNNNRGSNVFTIIGVTFFLIVSIIVSLYVGNKQVDLEAARDNNESTKVTNKLDGVDNSVNTNTVESIKLAIDSTKATEFTSSLDYVLQNVFKDSYDHLVPDNNRNSINLFNDEVTKFKLVYYLIERYGLAVNKKYDLNTQGYEESGYYAIKYDYFKSYYKEITGQDFNESILTQVSDNFTLSNDYLYGIVLSGTRSNYELTAESFIQEGSKYTFTVLVKELDENEQVLLTYKINLELSKTKDKYTINSIVVA